MRARYLRARSAFRLRRADVGCLAPQELLSQAGRVARQDVRHVRAAEARLLPDYKQHDRGTLVAGCRITLNRPSWECLEFQVRGQDRRDVKCSGERRIAAAT